MLLRLHIYVSEIRPGFVHLGTFIYCICHIIEVDCPVLSV